MGTGDERVMRWYAHVCYTIDTVGRPHWFAHLLFCGLPAVWSGLTIEHLVTIISIVLGGGGIAAYIRARGQNRYDLLASAAERIARLEQRADELDKRNDDLVAQNAELLAQVAVLKRDNQEQERRLATQRTLIDELQTRVAQLQFLEEANAKLRQQLQIEQSKREFLEREVNTLRIEIAHLRGRLGEHDAHGHQRGHSDARPRGSDDL